MSLRELPHLKEFDSEIYQVVEDETNRQREHLELIASENFISEPVLEALGTTLNNKYAEGYPANTHDDKGNMLVKNKDLTIPPTGGIGTVIFAIAGIALMAGAFVAIKKRSAEE